MYESTLNKLGSEQVITITDVEGTYLINFDPNDIDVVYGVPTAGGYPVRIAVEDYSYDTTQAPLYYITLISSGNWGQYDSFIVKDYIEEPESVASYSTLANLIIEDLQGVDDYSIDVLKKLYSVMENRCIKMATDYNSTEHTVLPPLADMEFWIKDGDEVKAYSIAETVLAEKARLDAHTALKITEITDHTEVKKTEITDLSTTEQGTISSLSTTEQGNISSLSTTEQDNISSLSTAEQDTISNLSTTEQGTISSLSITEQNTINELSDTKQSEITILGDTKLQELDDKFNELIRDNGIIPVETVSLHDLDYGRWWTADITAFGDSPSVADTDKAGCLDILISDGRQVLKFFATTGKINYQIETATDVYTDWMETGGAETNTFPVGNLGAEYKFAPVKWDSIGAAWVKTDTINGAHAIAVNCDTADGVLFFDSRVKIPSGALDEDGNVFEDGHFYYTSQTTDGKFQKTKPTTGMWQCMFQVMTYDAELYAMIEMDTAEDITPLVVQSGNPNAVATEGYVDNKTGDLSTLTTTEKGSLVSAINEVKGAYIKIDATLDAGGNYLEALPGGLTCENCMIVGALRKFVDGHYAIYDGVVRNGGTLFEGTVNLNTSNQLQIIAPPPNAWFSSTVRVLLVKF